MPLGYYEALDATVLRAQFLDYIDAVDMPLMDYFAVGVQDRIHQTSTSMMSRLEWQQQFHSLNLASDDPVRKASFNTQSNLFTFDSLDHQNSAGEEVMRQRRRHEIENGIVLMRRSLGYNFILTLATGYKNFKPYQFYIDYHDAINRTFDDLTAMVTPSTKKYQIAI